MELQVDAEAEITAQIATLRAGKWQSLSAGLSVSRLPHRKRRQKSIKKGCPSKPGSPFKLMDKSYFFMQP
jgi:hypothetical protein